MKIIDKLNWWDVIIHVVNAELRPTQLWSRRRVRSVGVTRQKHLGGQWY